MSCSPVGWRHGACAVAAVFFPRSPYAQGGAYIHKVASGPVERRGSGFAIPSSSNGGLSRPLSRRYCEDWVARSRRRLASAQSEVTGDCDHNHHKAHNPDNVAHFTLNGCRSFFAEMGLAVEALPFLYVLLCLFLGDAVTFLDAPDKLITLARDHV